MTFNTINFDSLKRLESLSCTQQADELMSTFTCPLIRGSVVAYVRYGTYEAGKILCNSGVSIRLALALARFAQHRMCLDFTDQNKNTWKQWYDKRREVFAYHDRDHSYN